MEEQRGLGGGGRPQGRREVVEKEGGCGGGGRLWRRRETMGEEGSGGGGGRSWRRREAVEEEGGGGGDVLLGGAEESPTRGWKHQPHITGAAPAGEGRNKGRGLKGADHF